MAKQLSVGGVMLGFVGVLLLALPPITGNKYDYGIQLILGLILLMISSAVCWKRWNHV